MDANCCSTSGERTLPAVFRSYSSMRGSSGFAKWNGHCSVISCANSSAVCTDDSFSHDAAICSRRCTGSNDARFFSTSARYFADGTPLDTIVCAAMFGKSTAFCSATNAPYEWPSTAYRSSPIERASDTTSSAIVSSVHVRGSQRGERPDARWSTRIRR